jgi:hypothetical protein
MLYKSGIGLKFKTEHDSSLQPLWLMECCHPQSTAKLSTNSM